MKRFLDTQIGSDWEEIYQQIQKRIPTKLKQYQQVVYWYVADKVEIVGDKAFDRREQQLLNFGVQFVPGMVHKDYVVSPFDNKLYRFREFGEQLQAGILA